MMRSNRLVYEKSPYLQQHAGNPVDWYPWCSEAFDRAREQDKPIFLSIGYSTCHWCHVMERESFENSEIAELLNREYVAIKVDREERPDIDAVYMSVCQALTGGGGWPLNLLLAPDQRPFWAGVYLPPYSRNGRPGLYELLRDSARMWREQRELLLRAGSAVLEHIGRKPEQRPPEPAEKLLCEAVEIFSAGFDARNGGFGRAPKFPAAHNLLFLMRYAGLRHDRRALVMVEHTLCQMARGGIFDHIGGGFSRYSTDARWLAPHFEKMLYDNALLAYTYVEAYERTGDDFYRRVAVQTLDYVLRELSDPKGGFYCGQDADSDGIEGKYYTFIPAEIEEVLGKEDAAAFCHRYGIVQTGNFDGKSIPNLLDCADWRETGGLNGCRKKLYDYRLARTSLHRDEKVLTAWNALMIAAFSKAARVLGDGRYLRAARRAVQFINSNLTDEKGRLYLRWCDGQAAYAGQLDDYAFLAWALLELYACTYEAELLQKAVHLAELVEQWFADPAGGYYLIASDSEQLITRPKELYDGAMPSGNAVMGYVLVKLMSLTGERRWAERATRQLRFIAGSISTYPAGYSFSLMALLESIEPRGTLVCALGGPPDPELAVLTAQTGVDVMVKTRANASLLAQAAPMTAGYAVPDQGAAYYLCKDGACRPPVYSLDALRALMEPDMRER